MTPPLIRFNQLSLSFSSDQGRVRAVQDVTFDVQPGQTVGIVGESGSGKTTLGMALLRLTASKGEIKFTDKILPGSDCAAMRPLRAKCQTVYQDPYAALPHRLSVERFTGEGLE